MGHIITFYSYKGGVGRSMALSNIAIILSQWKYKVLVVDWDLEAPGLEFFFKDYLLDLQKITQNPGIIDLITSFINQKQTKLKQISWDKFISKLALSDVSEHLHILTAGKRDKDYFTKVREFDIHSFYDKDGGYYLEEIREHWKQTYDFVLIDSRTGITDIGGVCTIQLPDIVAFLFTATEQSILGIKDVHRKVRDARKRLPVDRLGLMSIPIPTKFDTKEEYKISQEWLDRFVRDLPELYAGWLPTSIDKRSFLEITKIPYVSYFSFGEKLAVIEQGTNDPTGLGYAYENVAALIANKLNLVEDLIDDRDHYVRTALKKGVSFATGFASDFVFNDRSESPTKGKALIVGIDNYPNWTLQGCVDNATRMSDLLSLNDDGSPNFDCKTLLSSTSDITSTLLMENIQKLFSKETNIALLYFAGCSLAKQFDLYILGQDTSGNENAISVQEILKFANRAKSNEVAIIFDTFYTISDSIPKVSDTLGVRMGVSFLMGINSLQSAEVGNVISLTDLVCEALKGGASDIFGNVTMQSIFGYVSSTLGAWDARPLFKSNSGAVMSIRECSSLIDRSILRLLTTYFHTIDSELQLDPSFEPTTQPKNLENEKILTNLLKLRNAGLLIPIGTEHLYFAALESRSCKLTSLGRHYWQLVKQDRI